MDFIVQQSREAVVCDILKHALRHPLPFSRWRVGGYPPRRKSPIKPEIVRCCEDANVARQVKDFLLQEGLHETSDDNLESPLVCVYRTDEGSPR